MSLPYEPWESMQKLQEEMNRLFGNALSGASGDSSRIATSQWVPAVDIKEEPDRFLLMADVPGVSRDDIEITMDNGMLTVRGERRLEAAEGESSGYRRVERVRGSFYRRFSMPDTADIGKVAATCKDGVLEVVIPKKEAVQPRKIKVSA